MSKPKELIEINVGLHVIAAHTLLKVVGIVTYMHKFVFRYTLEKKTLVQVISKFY